jgi:hypothetical protein
MKQESTMKQVLREGEFWYDISADAESRVEKMRIGLGFVYTAAMLVAFEGVGMVADLWAYSTGRKPWEAKKA